MHIRWWRCSSTHSWPRNIWWWLVSVTPWWLYQREKRSRCAWSRFGGSQGRSGHCGEEEIPYRCRDSNCDLFISRLAKCEFWGFHRGVIDDSGLLGYQFWRLEKNKIFCPCPESNPGSSWHSIVTTLIELSRLLCRVTEIDETYLTEAMPNKFIKWKNWLLFCRMKCVGVGQGQYVQQRVAYKNCVDPLYSLVVTLCTTSFNIHKFYVLPTRCICFFFFVDLRTNSDYFTVQH
jgi:hypothetical protein